MPKLKADPDAESLAIQGLAYIAGDNERLGRFLSLTGLGPHNLRQAAAENSFLVAVLDYLSGDETLLHGFAADSGLSPIMVVQARERLAGHQSDPNLD